MSSLDLDPALIAHARTVPEMPTPALTCHLGFRLPPPEDHEKDKAALVDRINAFLDHVDGLLDNRKIRFTVDEKNPGHAGMELRRTDESLSVRLKTIANFEISVSIEIEAEYVTYSFRAYPVALQSDLLARGPELELHAAFTALEALLQCDFEDDQKSNTAIEAIYESAWSAIFRDLRIESLLTDWGPKRLQEARRGPDQPVGSLFCEFRGLILRTRCVESALDPNASVLDALNRSMKEEVETLHALRRPAEKYSVSTSFVPGKQAHLDHVPTASIAYLNSRPNFFSRLIGFRRAETVGPNYAGNSVLCHLYDGFAVYGSTLGADSGSGHRLRYFVVYGGPSRHQLARLLHRLHSAGEARLAALFDYAKLRAASRKVRELDHGIDLMDERASSKSLNTARDLFRHVTSELRKVSGGFSGGLAYRVSRSAYYDNLLEQRVTDLNVQSIPGWQTYAGFIRRNLWHHYRSIQNIGARFINIQKRLRLLEVIAADERNERRQETLVKLQETADFIGIAAFTYYGGNVAALAIKVANKHMSPDDRSAFCGAQSYLTRFLCTNDEKLLELLASGAGYLGAFIIALLLRWSISRRRG